MPASLSTSMTTAGTSAYIYPQDTANVNDDQSDDILYTLDLGPGNAT
jgi:hypothetical protein